MGRAVITGAARGLGRALALRYLEQGQEVWAGCRAPARAGGPGRAGRARVRAPGAWPVLRWTHLVAGGRPARSDQGPVSGC